MNTPDYTWGEIAVFANSATVHKRVKCAAILYNGRVYEGLMHHLIGHRMLADGVCQRPFPGGPAQGFTTTVGCFVNREEALIIAVNAGQVEYSRCSAPPNLYSEDLIRAEKDKLADLANQIEAEKSRLADLINPEILPATPYRKNK